MNRNGSSLSASVIDIFQEFVTVNATQGSRALPQRPPGPFRVIVLPNIARRLGGEPVGAAVDFKLYGLPSSTGFIKDLGEFAVFVNWDSPCCFRHMAPHLAGASVPQMHFAPR